MQFITYDQSIQSNNDLLEYIFDTLQENLSFIYGENMITEDSRNDWINNNLNKKQLYWRIIIAHHKENPCGFIIYTIENRCLTICDLEINKPYQGNPVVLKNLFINTFFNEKGKWDLLTGYINHKNTYSKKNFLKLAYKITEKERGLCFSVTKEKIIKKFFIKHPI